jgi:hypothetical protein
VTELTTIFKDNQTAARAVSRYIASLPNSPHRFVLRPYQYQSPKLTYWWFIPSNDWPAYHHSKLSIHTFRPDNKYLFAGFYVEQGLPKELEGEEGVKPSFVAQPDWYWFEFLDCAKNGQLDAALRDVISRSQCPAFVYAEVWQFNRVQDRDSGSNKPDDTAVFAIRSETLQFELEQGGNEVLSSLDDCQNLRELAERFGVTQEFRWYWVNLFIGIEMLYRSAESTGAWGAAEIWHNALEPWLDWVH